MPSKREHPAWRPLRPPKRKKRFGQGRVVMTADEMKARIRAEQQIASQVRRGQ
jgi:hypothetical protein